MSGDGFVFLHRALLESEVFAHPELLKTWVYCLLRACHKTEWFPMKTGRGTTRVKCEAGQFVFGRAMAAKALRMRPSTLQGRMKTLQDMQNLVVNPVTHFSIVTICNWERYQSANQAASSGNPSTIRQPTVNHPSHTINTTLDLIGNLTSLPSIMPEGGVKDGSEEAKRASSLLIPIPSSLDTPEFCAAFKSWKGHLWSLTNGRLSFATLGEHLTKFDSWGPSRSVEAIRYTIGKANWRDPALPPEQLQESAAAAAPKPMTAAERRAEELAAQEEHERRRAAR